MSGEALPGGEAGLRHAGREFLLVLYASYRNLKLYPLENAVVQKALDELAAKGARVVSPITRVGDKWMASCDHPEKRASECKVERLGLTSIVTGPTRQAVAAKVEELVDLGARLTGEIEQDGDVWTAVCDSGGAGG